MQKIRGNKWNRRICKWIASLLTVALLVNQSSLSVLAEEVRDEVCQCDTRCSADSVNEGCPVCAQDYGRCEGAEDVPDTDTGEETENPDTGEGVDTGTGEETEDPDAGIDTDTGEETEDPDAGEDVNTDVDTEIVSDVDAEDEGDALLQDEVAKNVAEGGAVSLALGRTFNYDGLKYRILSDGGNKVEVIGCANETPASEDLVIPSRASDGTNVYEVVSIGDSAFDAFRFETLKYKNIKSITIPDSVTSIGMQAFRQCSGLTSITIPNSVNSIGDYAFLDCSGLTSITIPDSIDSIALQTFGRCRSLTSITIPGSVNTIGVAAFEECSGLTSITIPSSVDSIGAQAFRECSSLTSITIPDSVTDIEYGTFMNCSSLSSITIPDRVNSIDSSAFQECSSLESITIPRSVTQIGGIAFWRCSNLTNVTILNDKINIGRQAFRDCKDLTSLWIALSEEITGTPTIGDSCFQGCPEPDDRYLTFLTEDGTMELSETTTPKLSEAVEAYDAADAADGIDNDGMWYGWKLTKAPAATNYPVTIKVNIDGSTWSDSGKTFALSKDNGSTFITDLTNNVPAGTYTIYETTGATDSAAYVDTRVTVEVTDSDVEATVNYYTVTFYDGDTPLGEPQIVLNNTTVRAPSPSPTKDGYTFYRWVTSKGGSEEFDFNNTHITAKTDIYASWIKAEEKTFTITALAGTGGSISPSGEVPVISGADQQFIITPDEGYRVSSVLVDGVEQLNSTQASDHARAGITDAGNGVKHYDFENVTSNHSLTAAFAAISTGGGGSDDTGDDDDPDDNDPDDNNGGGGSGGGGSTGGGGSGGGGNTGDGGSGGGGDTGGGSGGSDGGDTGGGSDNSGGDSAGNSSPAGSGKSASTALSDKGVKNGADVINVSNTAPASKDSEPKTGDASHMEIYATIAMIAGLSYILLYFADGKNGMTEEEKKEIVEALVTWAKNGSRVKKYAALSVIFLILVYYHSIGKRTTVDWKEVYER